MAQRYLTLAALAKLHHDYESQDRDKRKQLRRAKTDEKAPDVKRVFEDEVARANRIICEHGTGYQFDLKEKSEHDMPRSVFSAFYDLALRSPLHPKWRVDARIQVLSFGPVHILYGVKRGFGPDISDSITHLHVDTIARAHWNEMLTWFYELIIPPDAFPPEAEPLFLQVDVTGRPTLQSI